MIDALQQFLPLAKQSRILEDLHLGKNETCIPFGVLTLHRPANVDSLETLGILFGVVETLADKLPIIFPVHPRTRQKLAALSNRYHPRLRVISSSFTFSAERAWCLPTPVASRRKRLLSVFHASPCEKIPSVPFSCVLPRRPGSQASPLLIN